MPDDMTRTETSWKSLEIDVAKYQAMIDDPELDEGQKRAFIEALWTILMAFIDLGFELHETDLACGQLHAAEDDCCDAAHNMVGLEQLLRNKFEEALTDPIRSVEDDSDGKT